MKRSHEWQGVLRVAAAGGGTPWLTTTVAQHAAARVAFVAMNVLCVILCKHRPAALQQYLIQMSLTPEFLDSNLRAFAQLELGVPSPSLEGRATIIAIHIESMSHPAIRATVVTEFQTGGKFAHALSLTCESMSGFRFAYIFLQPCVDL